VNWFAPPCRTSHHDRVYRLRATPLLLLSYGGVGCNDLTSIYSIVRAPVRANRFKEPS
jgi:hypothetical protein